MNRVQTAIAVVGLLALLEAGWGMVTPGSVKQMAGWFVRVGGERQPVLGALLALVALLFLVLILVDQPLSSWVLLVLAAAFLGFAAVCLRPNGLRGLLSAWILNRTEGVVRAIYAIEGLIAVGLLVVALSGR